ncbi:MAG: hypothetical protein ACEPOV_12945 [Hyphomicrobiales bacterium]
MKKIVLYLSIVIITGLSSYAISSDNKGDYEGSNYIVLMGTMVDDNVIRCPAYDDGICVIHKSIVGKSVSAEEYKKMQEQ